MSYSRLFKQVVGLALTAFVVASAAGKIAAAPEPGDRVRDNLYGTKFVTAQEGWAVGAEGTIIHTVDAGLHWTSERSETQHPLERVFFTDKSRGWAVGFGGTVVSYQKQ